MNQSTIAIVIITNRNDERFLNALQSAYWADEIIILDNNSNNDWSSFQNEKIRIIDIPDSISDFSKQKNNAIELANSDWVFFLDSDEVILSALAMELRNLMVKNVVHGAIIQRQDTYLSKPLRFGEAGDIRFTRFLKKGHGKWKGKVHEVLEINGKVSTVKTPLYHYSHQNISEFVTKIDQYAKLRAGEVRLTTNQIWWQSLTYPIGKFLVNHFIKLGILDGYRGIVYTLMMSIHSLSVRVHAFESKKDEK